MRSTGFIALTALALVASSGGIASAQQHQQQKGTQPAQTDTRDQRDRTNSASKSQGRTPMMLCYFDDLKGKDITTTDNSSVAEIKDVIFDRHSGDIAAYVVSDDRILAPSDLKAVLGDEGEVNLRTTLIKDALKGRMELDADAFDTKAAKSTDVASWWNRFASESKKYVHSDMPAYHPEKLRSTDKLQVQGVVESLDRVRGEGSTYRTIATIREPNGNTRTIVLGPTWYLADEKALPMRGQRIDVTVVPLESEEEQWAASDMNIDGGKSIKLRDGDALNPVWYKKGDTQAVMSVQRRMLLASSLMGDDVKCRDESSGEVENLAIDLANHRVMALVIDPNENFMGAADTLRLIPVSVASPSSDDLVFVDAEKDMIVNAPAAPDSISRLNNAWQVDSTFKQRPIANR